MVGDEAYSGMYGRLALHGWEVPGKSRAGIYDSRRCSYEDYLCNSKF